MFVPAMRRTDPPRRPRRVLRVGRAARRPPAAGPAGDRRAAAWCWRPATRPRPAGCARRWAARQARRLCPEAVVVPPRMSAYTEASKAVFEVFDDTTPLVEGLSIDEAFLDVGGLRRVVGHAGGDRRAAAARRCSSEVGLPITVGVARTKFLAKVASGGGQARRAAGRAARAASWPSSTRCRSSGCGASGRSRRRSCTSGASPRSARWPRSARRRWWRCSAGRRAATCTRWPTTATPGRWRSGRRRRSIGSQRALGRRPAHAGRDRRRRSSASSTGSPGACGRPAGSGRTVVLRLRFDDFARATRSHTLPGPPPTRATILAAVRGLLAGGRAADRRAGAHAGRHRRRQPRRRPAPCSSRCRSTRQAGGALDAALDDVRDRFGRAAVTRAVLLGRPPASRGPAPP